MAKRANSSRTAKFLRSAAFAAVGSLLLSPVVVPAFAAKFYGSNGALSLGEWASHFTPAGIDSRLAERMRRPDIAENRFPFTPAGLGDRTENVLTVAARATAPSGNKAVSVRAAMAQIEAGAGTTVRLNNSNFQLTAARGWQGFTLPKPAIMPEQPRLTDLGGNGFRLDAKPGGKPSRFNTDVKVDNSLDNSIAHPRGNAAVGDVSVKAEGRLRVAQGVDLTAGVRISSERDRVTSASDARPDSEAVYVGTKIRF